MIKREYDYDCDIDPKKTIRYIGMGEGEFANTQGEILSTMGIASCVGLMAFSKQFSYLAHIEMGNCIGSNFDSNGNCIRIEELLERIRQNSNQEKVWIGTISSERYKYERKWWDEPSIALDE